jgi:glycolate oxidase iron-sulfur subunit
MPEIKDLTKQMQELEEQLVTCMKCGMCQSVCPVFEQTHKEADVARGKLVLLESLMNDIFDNPHGVNKRLNKCLLCGSCAANCPSGVNVIEIFIKARAIITGYLKLSFIKKIVFRKILAQPLVFDKIISMGSKVQNFLLTNRQQNTQTASIKFLSPLLKNRRIIPVADSFFQKSIDKLINHTNSTGANSNRPNSKSLRVAFFTGCLIDKIFPQVGIATAKSLLHHNMELFIPKNQGCCGIPALAAGDTDTFLDLVKYNLQLFPADNFDYLVTSCATCTSTLKKFWPSMAHDLDPSLYDQVTSLAEKTLDISQFLSKIAGLKKQKYINNKPQKIVTYHDPCHLVKSLGVRKEPREVIHAASNYILKEMTDADQCCGMGGSFNLYHYDISSKIGNIKKENIEATGCQIIATSCPACMMQISDMLSKRKGSIEVKHPIELYAKGIK